jgi:DNA-binding response OmpR family regulator/archaellum biogenesis ATPase FlaH
MEPSGETVRPSGVALLDSVLGGVAPGSSLVLSGAAGSGRTVLCLQLIDQALRRGESAAFLTGEPARLVLGQADGMALDLRGGLRSDQLRLLEAECDIGATTRMHGASALMDSIDAVAPEAQLILIDPFTMLTGEIADEIGIRQLVRGLFDRAAEAGRIVVVTTDTGPVNGKNILDRVLKEVCGAVIELESGEDGVYELKVARSRSASRVHGQVRFVIGEGGASLLEGEVDSILANPGVVPAGGARTEGEASEIEPVERRKVLVIEDDEAMLALVKEWVAKDYDFIGATDGLQGVSEALGQRPDIIVLDLVLPRVNGFEVMRTLRRAGMQQPILVLSGKLARAADRVRALVLGATDLMHKPVQGFELLQKMETLLMSAPTELRPEADVSDAEALLGGDDVLILDSDAFAERLGRACQFGKQYNLPAMLVGVEAPTTDCLDNFVLAATEGLRCEDAINVVGKKRAICLLVSTDLAFVPKVLARFTSKLRDGHDTSTQGFRWSAMVAATELIEENYEGLFKETSPWPLL